MHFACSRIRHLAPRDTDQGAPQYVTGQAKLALAYNITPRFVLAFNGVVNNIRFKASDRMIATGAGSTLTDNPEIKMRLMTWDWLAVLYFGVRFL